MATPEKNKIVRNMKRMLQFFNIKNTDSTLEKATNMDVNTPILIRHFSEHELSKMTSIHGKNDRNKAINPKSYLDAVSQNTKEIVSQNKKLYYLNPEIKQAKQIFVSSIISPNDMQVGAINVTSNIDGMDEASQQKLNDELSKYFNETIEFSVKLEEWLGNALFESGAAPILVLPYQNVTKLVQYDDNKQSAGLETLNIKYPTVDVKSEIVPELTGLLIDSDFSIDDKFVPTLSGYLAEETMKVAANSSSIISYSHDVTKIAKSQEKNKKKTKKMAEDLSKYFIKSGEDSSITMLISDEVSGDSESKTHPTVLELPSSAVIPVTVPGSHKTHIGYFVLVDEWGNPVGEDVMCKANNTQDISMSRVGGSSIYKNLVQNNIMNKMTESERYQAASSAFGLTIKNTVEHTFKDMELEGVTIERYQTMSNCLFYHLLRKQKIQVIFVPEQLMVYYAFDYRSDGTGKSMIEDLSYILALRTTLIIANIMGTIKNAIDKQTISIDLDEQDTNIEQTMDILKNMYIKKNMPGFYNDPDLVSRDITANSLSIVPKNIPGLEHSLEVNTERRGADTQNVDDTLMEKLSNMTSLGMGLPPTALNLLSEDEYSRSVATNNLFFANNIRSIQRRCAKHNNKFARLIVTFSTYLQDKIKKDLNDNTEDKDWLASVISNIQVMLANPNIVATKAQYEELKEFMDLVDNLMNKCFPDEVYPDDSDSDTKAIVGTMRAHIQATLVRDYIDAVGMGDLIKIPTIEEFDISKIENMQQFMMNVKKGVDNLKKVLGSGEEDNSGY